MPIEGAYFEIACETVIFAIGQALVSLVAEGCEVLQIAGNEIKIEAQSLGHPSPRASLPAAMSPPPAPLPPSRRSPPAARAPSTGQLPGRGEGV